MISNSSETLSNESSNKILQIKTNKNIKDQKESVAKSACRQQNGYKRVEKVYDLSGQKRDPPDEFDGIWSAPKEEAKKVYQKKLKRTRHEKLGRL